MAWCHVLGTPLCVTPLAEGYVGIWNQAVEELDGTSEGILVPFCPHVCGMLDEAVDFERASP